MFGDLAKAVRQLDDPRLRRLLWISAGLTLGAALLLWAGIGWLLAETALFAMIWLEWVTDLLGGAVVVLLTIMLLPAGASAFLGVFLEDAAAAVEARHYPDLPAAPEQPVWQGIVTGLRFLGVTVAANVLLLPFLLLGPVFPFVFYLVNGYLLSREYYELVAFRRLDDSTARHLRRAHQGSLLISGVVIVFLLTVPVINLIIPLVATAFMVHRFERLRRRHGIAPDTRSPSA